MESISRIIKKLMITEPYYGLFACSLNKKWSESIETAAVAIKGINFELHINKKFWDSINTNEQYGTIKHELLHLAFFHVTDMDKWHIECNDHNILNIAMDLEVQSYIDKIYWGDPNKYAAEGIFMKCPDLLYRQGTKYYINFLKQIQQTSPGEGMKYGEGNKNELSPSTVSEIKEILSIGPKDDHSIFGQISNSDQKNLFTTQLEWQMKEAYEQIIKSRGNIPGELREKLKDLLTIKPPVFNWKAYLRRMLGFSYDIYYKRTKRKESNRFEDAYGLKHNKKHSLLIAIDTSGSINKEELEDFFSEVYHIWKTGADVDIIECDMNITNKYKYKGKCPQFISGGGGTSFLPCIDYYNHNYNKYNTMVYFTDGFGDQNECKPFKKVIWMISSDGNQNSEYPGYKICIPKK